MSKTAVVTARVEPELKKDAEDVLRELGLTASQAITIYYKQIAVQRGIPFELKLPNQETIAAIRETDQPGKLPAFQNVDALFADLES
jgi:DNA-damage-inducible protein J